MPRNFELFPKGQVVGVFRGFREGGLEFHAELVLPYQSVFQNVPMHGQFLLVQLESPDEAVLGRITSLSSEGKLAFGSGEEFNIRAVKDNRPIPEDLREQYLKYKVDIRVLGVLRNQPDNGLTFVPSHRRLPHVGSPVAFPSEDVLQEIAGHNMDGAAVGHFALGEYIYAENNPTFKPLDWMQLQRPEVLVKFPLQSLVSRRSFIFARAGFGKSNLTKLLFSTLYLDTPTVDKRGGRQVPVGTVIFDPDGEYFWPDDKGRPGLCDVEHLRDKLVVFTPRQPPSPFYGSFIVGGIKLDLRRLPPSDVISIALPPERQDQQNVSKLRGMSQDRWRELVELIDRDGNQASTKDISRLLNLDDRQDVEAIAARSNMTRIVKMIHDRSSQLMDLLLIALAEGKLCVVDISKMRGGQSLILSALILRRIFERNQEEFTAAVPRTIPTIAVVEEAQSVLNGSDSGSEAYVSWVKEGRKYDLGAMLITQQPGSIPVEILSQGDNWFIFHLLSAADLKTLQRANAHFSEDLLGVLLNEPIPGQGVFWSSVAGKSYPISIRALSFEGMYELADPLYNRSSEQVYAKSLRDRFAHELDQAAFVVEPDETSEESIPDPLERFERRAIEALVRDNATMAKIKSEEGIAWGSLKAVLYEHLPESLIDRDDTAYHLVPKALEQILGPQDQAWQSYKHPQRGATYVKVVSNSILGES